MKTRLLLTALLCCVIFSYGNILSAQTFTKVVIGPHVHDSASSIGCAWGDFNNDGNEDLYVTNGIENAQNNMLFLNEGAENDYTFTPFEREPIEYDRAPSRAASWGDYNNDGYLDLYVANQMGSNYNYLYLNTGGEGFTRYTEGILAYDNIESEPVSFVDYNNDGFLDILSGNYIVSTGLFHNNGDGSFTPFTEGPTMDALWAFSIGDYNNDRYPDIWTLCNSDGNRWLYINDGKGAYTKTRDSLILNYPSDKIGYGDHWVDYDNDGDWDMPNLGVCMYRNEGPEYDFKFRKITDGDSIVNVYGWPHWADIDNDGDLDCFIPNYDWPDTLILNNGDGTFTGYSSGIVEDGEMILLGAAWADYNNDGNMDLYVCRRDGNNFLYRNENENGNSWLKVKLKGTASNEAAIGAIVKVKTNTGDGAVWQMRAIQGQSEFFGQSSLIAHFGLGSAVSIDSMIVQWPSGHDTVLTDVAVNQLLPITEKFPEDYLRAEFNADVTVGLDELAVQFTDVSLVDPGTPVTSWSWDFGDDSEPVTDQNPSHTYSIADGEVFDVTLVISNGSDTDTLIRPALIKLFSSVGNIALASKATASSQEDGLKNPQMAIDGSTSSEWVAVRNDEEWFKIEFPGEYTIGKVCIQWSRGYGAEYSLQTSLDDVEWCYVYSVKTGDGGNDTLLFTGENAKYIKWEGYDRGSVSPYSIKEFEVYLSDGNVYDAPGVADCLLGIDKRAVTPDGINIYPNPVGDELNIDFDQPLNRNTIVEITDITGKVHKKTELTTGSLRTTMDVSGLPKGIYFLCIRSDNSVFNYKIIKL